MSEDVKRQTHTSGEVFVHPRGERYRDNFCRIYGCRPFCGCETAEEFDARMNSEADKCEKECEGCECHGKKST